MAGHSIVCHEPMHDGAGTHWPMSSLRAAQEVQLEVSIAWDGNSPPGARSRARTPDSSAGTAGGCPGASRRPGSRAGTAAGSARGRRGTACEMPAKRCPVDPAGPAMNRLHVSVRALVQHWDVGIQRACPHRPMHGSHERVGTLKEQAQPRRVVLAAVSVKCLVAVGSHDHHR